jgi:hypothetical protein
MTCVAFHKLFVRPIELIHETVRAVALVKLTVMIVVDLWAHQEWQMKAAVFQTRVRGDETKE